MADQEQNDAGVPDKSIRMLEDSSFDGTVPNPVESTDVVKVERAECESLGTSSCNVEQEMRNSSEPIAMESSCVVKLDGAVCENLGISGSTIEEGMGNISLVRGFESSVIIEGNGGKDEIMTNEDESESSESESANPSSSTSCSGSSSSDSESSSTSGSSSDDDDDIGDNKEERKAEKGEGQTINIQVEAEEGEIRDSDEQELVTETAASDDDENEDVEEVTLSVINDDDDEDDDANTNAKGRPIRSKNELKDLTPVPPVNVTLEPHHRMLPVGIVMSIINAQVIVEGVEKHDPLNEGSILWITESRTPLGLVDEIFGPVKNPYYAVRYNSENEVPTGIHGGALISFVPEFANHVLNNKDLYKKGYDASGLNDEELSDETEFSDDEKEQEYKKMQKMTKRGFNDENLGKQRNNRKKVPKKKGAVPTYPAAPAAPSLDHEKFTPFPGNGQGLLGATTIVPPFPPTSAGPNLAPNGVWSNGIPLLQPQPALLPNGFPPNALPWFPGNTHNSFQFPVTGIPFQQQFDPSLGSLPPTMFPGVQSNIFAQPMYPPGLVGQSQMPFGLSSHIPQIQPPICAGEQRFSSNELQSDRSRNSHSSNIPDNRHSPHQFHAGASGSRGRKTFRHRGRKGWRPAK